MTDLKTIEQSLRNLKDVSDLRAFIQSLGYEFVDQPLPTRGFKPELKLRVKEDSLRQIAQYRDLPIIFCEVVSGPKSARERNRVKTERLLLRSLPAQFAECLLVTLDTKTKLWHFVNSKPFGNKLRLRRFAVGENEKLRTAAERLSLIRVTPGEDWASLLNKHETAFDRERVTDEFFNAYREIFMARKKELAEQCKDEHAAHNFLQQFLNRLMFIYFIQRKRWLGNNGDCEFIKQMWQTYKQGDYPPDSFYEKWLTPLFFSALNNKRGYKRKGLPPVIEQAFDEAPYLNGGLFREKDGIDDLNVTINDELFQEVFERLLDRYNFTVQEDTPFDQSVSVDPEMLGVVFEKLVNKSDTQDEQGSSGIFYTPRIEVDFMCRRSLLEYLANHTDTPREALYRLLFTDETESIGEVDAANRKDLRDALLKVTVVDPACGSGAFLVGMMQVILDVERRLADLDGRTLDEFNEKKRIIERSLYGVDVKDWAIGVAQLRLWLSLIVDADEKKLDLQSKKIANEALLPSLSFKMRVGDSLVQEIADKPFPIREHAIELDHATKAKITELRKLKSNYFFNRGDVTERELRQKERAIFRDILDRDMKKCQHELVALRNPEKHVEQVELLPTGKAKQELLFARKLLEQEAESKIAELEERFQQLKSQRDELSNPRKSYLFWGIEFAEIFYGNGNNGFDIVIGNPPYVRQEKIADPRHDEPTVEQKKEYKAKLLESAKLDWGDSMNVGGQADLYVYFYLRGLALLDKNGVFCFITSNSWLDVAYGKELQEFLVTRTPIYAIYDNQAKRSFKHADVNTIIALFGAPGKKQSAVNQTARFVMFKKPFEEAITFENLLKAESATEVTSWDDTRVFPVRQKKLWEEGLQPESEDPENQGKEKAARQKKTQTAIDQNWTAPYIGNKWGGKYLRAPDIYWKILEKGKGKLVRLGDMAEVRRGFTTGANEFFYLDQDKIDEWGIEEEFLKPVIVSPRECKSVEVKPADLKTMAFVCHSDKLALKGKQALQYIKWGEKQGFDDRPSCRGRSKWYELGERDWARVLWPMIHNNRQSVFWNPQGTLVDHNLFEIYGYNDDVLWGSLAWTGQILFRELHGRGNLGQGALKTEGIDIRTLYCFKTSDPDVILSICEGRTRLSLRDIGSVSSESEQPDRRELDRVFFNLLGLNSSE